MKVLILEDNLLWSERLRLSAAGAGHEAVVGTSPKMAEGFDVVVVDVTNPRLGTDDVLRSLNQLGVTVIGHAGHVEKERIAQAQELCQSVATNGQITFQLGRLLGQVAAP